MECQNFSQKSFAVVKIDYFCSKWKCNELNHAATGDLKNSGRGMKMGSSSPDIPIPPLGECPPPPVFLVLQFDPVSTIACCSGFWEGLNIFANGDQARPPKWC